MIGAGFFVFTWSEEEGPVSITIMDTTTPYQAKLTIEPGKRGHLVARLGHSESHCAHPLREIERLRAMLRRGDN